MRLPAYPSCLKNKNPFISIYRRFLLWLFPVFYNAFEALIHFFRHRNRSGFARCLGILNDILHISGSLKLMVYTYEFLFFKINIRKCQSSKLRNTKSGFKEDKHSVIVSFVMLIILNKFQELFFLAFWLWLLLLHYRLQLLYIVETRTDFSN